MSIKKSSFEESFSAILSIKGQEFSIFEQKKLTISLFLVCF